MIAATLRACVFGLVAVVIMATPADAFKKVNLPGTRSKDYMKSLCSQSGGTYAEGQGQYGCYSNCGDAGRESDACGINCSEKDNTCYGWNPGKKRPSSNPMNVLRPPGGLAKSAR